MEATLSTVKRKLDYINLLPLRFPFISRIVCHFPANVQVITVSQNHWEKRDTGQNNWYSSAFFSISFFLSELFFM